MQLNQKATVQLYFMLGRVELHSNISSLLKDSSDIHSFPTPHMWLRPTFCCKICEYDTGQMLR